MDIETKARLIAVGTVDASCLPAFGPSSTAGPGAGGRSVFFGSGERMVRLSVVDSSPLILKIEDDGTAVILQEGREVARGRLLEPLFHCPEQAYITVSEWCIYDCKFCAVPKLRGEAKTPERIREMVEEAAATGSLKAISLTSGVEVSPEEEGRRVAAIVRDLRRLGVPIGISISPYPGVNQLLKDAGAVEVKYNLETLDPEIFSKVCPGISMEGIYRALEEAVEVFGRGRVFSNIIVGLGESDETLMQGIDRLLDMGVLPVLRAVYPHPLRIGEAEMERPSAERLLSLARHLKKGMDERGLSGDALTMCFRCTGCDLIPGRDL